MSERKQILDAGSLVIRSAYNHLRYIKPSSECKPSMYAGKVESTILTLILDTFGVTPNDIENKQDVFRFISAFNLQWRAYDEVLDEVKYEVSPVTEDELDNTPVFHKYAGKNVRGAEAVQIALDSMSRVIPGKDSQSRQRRDKIEGLLAAYREKVANVANNPAYHKGEILSYSTAKQSKDDLTGTLGQTSSLLCAALLDLPEDSRTIEVLKGTAVAMQFGDDYLDWRKDWSDHRKRQTKTTQSIRPVENLLNATLEEFPIERNACETILSDTTRRSALWLKELAPNTLDLFQHRFQTELDKIPAHPYAETVKGIVCLTFYKILPVAPESGWFYRWAKY